MLQVARYQNESYYHRMGHTSSKNSGRGTQVNEVSNGTHLLELHFPTVGLGAGIFFMAGIAIAVAFLIKRYCRKNRNRQQQQVSGTEFPMINYRPGLTEAPNLSLQLRDVQSQLDRMDRMDRVSIMMERLDRENRFQRLPVDRPPRRIMEVDDLGVEIRRDNRGRIVSNNRQQRRYASVEVGIGTDSDNQEDNEEEDIP